MPFIISTDHKDHLFALNYSTFACINLQFKKKDDPWTQQSMMIVILLFKEWKILFNFSLLSPFDQEFEWVKNDIHNACIPSQNYYSVAGWTGNCFIL